MNSRLSGAVQNLPFIFSHTQKDAINCTIDYSLVSEAAVHLATAMSWKVYLYLKGQYKCDLPVFDQLVTAKRNSTCLNILII